MITVGDINILISKIKELEIDADKAKEIKFASMNYVSNAILYINQFTVDVSEVDKEKAKVNIYYALLNLASLCLYFNIRLKPDTMLLDIIASDMYTTIFNFYDVILSIDIELVTAKENAESIFNIVTSLNQICETNNIDINLEELVAKVKG